jgi:hypothetical protein
MKRILLPLLLLGSLSLGLSAQIQLAPLKENPVLRTEAHNQQLQLIQEATDLSGLPYEPPVFSRNEVCPPEEFGTFYLVSGETLIIEVDTIALGGGDGSSLTLIDCEPIDFGTVTFDSTLVTYVSNGGIEAAIDTVCVEFCNQDGDCELFRYPIVVRRAGQIRITDPVFLGPEEFFPEYCLDETVFPGELACQRFVEIPCEDNYDGEGRQNFWWVQYSQANPCLRYFSSRFAGTDTVCAVLCDEFNICDTFHIPFVIQKDTLGLPFFDDFSYDGPYPSIDYWLDRDAFINNTLSSKAPSIGMATLDGLNEGGRPYKSTGQADYLTSTYLDLTGTAGNVYLKFFASPKGLGLYPNEPDSLTVEFRNQQGDWVQVASVQGFNDDVPIPIDSVPDFLFYAIPIEGSDYLYDGFQFRFSNWTSPPGIYDLWHIDYVFVSDQQNPGSTFDDMAFIRTPSRLLANYTSMPWWHFENNIDEELENIPLQSGFFNHFDNTVAITESAITLREAFTGTTFPTSDNVVDGVDGNIPSKVATQREKVLTLAAFDGIKGVLNTQFPGADELDVIMRYQLTLNAQNPLFFRNDTVEYHNRFSNYFAYDDGTAESYIYFDNPQNDNPTLAVKYHSNVADTLRAIRFHFPHVNGDVENQLFNLKVWIADPNTDPAYEFIFEQPLYASSQMDTLQGFTTYVLRNILAEDTPIALPADTDFYIGFQQVSIINGGIPIGWDLNNEFEANVQFRTTDGDQWLPLPESFVGAPMIRPVVGTDTPIDTQTEEAPVATVQPGAIKLYPNPTQGQVFLEHQGRPVSNGTSFQLLTLTGQSVVLGKVQNAQVDLSRLAPGMYLLRAWNEEERWQATQRVVKE